MHIPAVLKVAPLQELLTMTRTNEDMEQLIWNPITAYDLRVSVEDIHALALEMVWPGRVTMQDRSIGVSSSHEFDVGDCAARSIRS